METRLIVWVIGILVVAVIALYFDNRHGEPGKPSSTEKMMKPRKGDADKERKERIRKISNDGMYGWMMVGKQFRPIRIVGSRNGKILVKVQHNYEKEEDIVWTVEPNKIFVTECTPGDYARLWREHLWHLEHAEDDQRAKEWHDQHYDERP